MPTGLSERSDLPLAVSKCERDLRPVRRSGVRLDSRNYPIPAGFLDRDDLHRVRPNRLRPVVRLLLEASLAGGVVLHCLVCVVLDAADRLSLSETLRGEVLLDCGAGIGTLLACLRTGRGLGLARFPITALIVAPARREGDGNSKRNEEREKASRSQRATP